MLATLLYMKIRRHIHFNIRRKLGCVRVKNTYKIPSVFVLSFNLSLPRELRDNYMLMNTTLVKLCIRLQCI